LASGAPGATAPLSRVCRHARGAYASWSAMQRVRAVICREPNRCAVEHKARIGDPIGVTADRGAEEAAAVEIAAEIVMAEHDVVATTAPVGRQQCVPRRAERNDARFKAVVTAQDYTFDRVAIRNDPKSVSCDL